MNKSVNQAACDEIEKIAISQNISLIEKYKDRILSWDIKDLKKIWAVGIDNNSGKKVLIKIRPSNSILPIKNFVDSELREKSITNHLASHDIKTQKVLAEQLDDTPQWIIREYDDGKTIGNMSFNLSINEDKLFIALKKLRVGLDKISNDALLEPFANYDWQNKIHIEFHDRRKYIVEFLGEEVATMIEKSMSVPARTLKPESLLHNDLAPQNIIESDDEYFVIDWGESALGPRALDWATVWSFAVFHPDLQDKFLEIAVFKIKDEKEQTVAKKIFLTVAARLMASFAEYHHYRMNLSSKTKEETSYNEDSLDRAWKNFKKLINKLS